MNQLGKTIVIWMFCIVSIPIITLEVTAETNKKMTFVFGRPKAHPITQELIRVYSEALNRLNIHFSYLDVPNKRACEYVNSGRVDGDLGRVYNFNDTYTNTVRVEESNNSVIFAAYSNQQGLSVDGWQSLGEERHKIECRRGEMICIENVSKFVPLDQLTQVDKLDQAVRKLFLGRTDIFIQSEPVMTSYLGSDEFLTISRGKKIYKIGIMGKITGHAFLHKKHADLAPKLSKILSEMKAEGLLNNLVDITMP